MLLRLKKLLNRFGYDVKKYHSALDTTIRPLGIKTILDIGANNGVFSAHMRQEFPEAMIYAFEPLSDCFQALQSRLAQDERFNAFPIALGSEAGEILMERSAFHPSSSLRSMSDLHKLLYPKTAESRPETINIARLDDVLAGERLEPGILVKIDVQGYEDKVLSGGTTIMKQASVAIIEASFVSLYEGQPLFNDICKMMDSLGFSYSGDMGRHYSRITDKLLYEDALFIKKHFMSA
jgi:FkbM family methyltransferase